LDRFLDEGIGIGIRYQLLPKQESAFYLIGIGIGFWHQIVKHLAPINTF
jgi:hypothetical protein